MIHKARAALSRMPPLSGAPIELRYRRESRHVHAGSFLRERRISLDPGLCRLPQEFSRILVHEMFHFVWLRLGNRRRQSFEAMIRREWREGIQGELGWSAERRKATLKERDVEGRTRAWRLYCCESFCDTAAWVYAGLSRHDEFTLDAAARDSRREWFEKLQRSSRTLPV
jgi:predicted SprT family Zn-dependent metalloprotease